MTAHDRIELNPRVMLGKPGHPGHANSRELIVRKLAEGDDEKSLIQAYPKLTAHDIHAALRYAATRSRMRNWW